MVESSNRAEFQEPWRVQAEAQSFRGRGESVYPGRLLVSRGGSFVTHPVDDSVFDPSTESIAGIATWGASAAWSFGMIGVDGGPAGAFAPLVAGESARPSTGVGRVDAWIARADVLRKLRRGTVAGYGSNHLSREQLAASIGQIEKIVRESAIALLQKAPSDQRPALLALARVADAQHPQDAELTAAILELTVSALAWKSSATILGGPVPAPQSPSKNVAGAIDGGDNGDPKPPPLPADVEAIDEHDAAILAFLLRSPSIRRKVSDVLPDSGPQDRKAVAKRLRKLADRTTPLVDYPKNGRSGVVILNAGAEALKRAAPDAPLMPP